MDLTKRRMQLYPRPATQAVAPATTANPKARGQKINKAALKKPKVKAPSPHPPMKQMIIQAITEMNERGGSSLAAIKKYLQGKYLVDVVKMGYLVRRTLVQAVADNSLVQTKGHGASGSFKLTAGAKKKTKVNSKIEGAPLAPVSLTTRPPTPPAAPKKAKATSKSKPKAAAPRAMKAAPKMSKAKAAGK